MRLFGMFALLLLAALPAASQPQVAPPPRPAPEPELLKHLDAWKAAATEVKSFKARIALKRTEFIFKQEQNFSGAMAWVRPNLVVLRLDNDADKTGTEYESFVCDGTAVHEYNAKAKTHTRWPLPGLLDPMKMPGPMFTLGVDGVTDRTRFQFSLVRADRNEVLIHLEPLRPADKAEFQAARILLTGPEAKTPYTAKAISLAKPNGDTEVWRLSEIEVNPPGISEKDFRPVRLPDFQYHEWSGFPPRKP